MAWITLATEDELSEQVGLRLSIESGLEVSQCLRKNGNGYLRSRIDNFCRLSEQQPVLLITDLDTTASPQRLIDNWLGTQPKPKHLLFRVAVREIEAWLLADHAAMKELLGRNVHKFPVAPDELADPKAELLRLAARASREVREDLVSERDSIASQGLGYNARLGAFARTIWNPQRAGERSPSLAGTLNCLHKLAKAIG